jgi:hemerythrin
MKTVTLRIDDGIIEKFLWLLKHFANEIKILDQSDYVSDDEYLRSIDGMVKSIQEARREADCNDVTLDKLDW